MKSKSTSILAAAALLSGQSLSLSAKEAEVEIRRPLQVKNVRQARGAVVTPDVRQGRGSDDVVTAIPDVRQGQGADDAALNADGTPHIRQGRGADDVVTATPDVRQGQGADDAVLNADGTPHIRQGRGADDVVTATPDVRQGQGADDAVLNADGTPHIRQGRGADDVVTATPDVRQGRGADDIIVTPTGALVPTIAALTAPAPARTQSRGQNQRGKVTTLLAKAQTASQTSGQQKKVTFRAAQQAQTSGLSASATQRSNGKYHLLDVSVTGFEKIPGVSTADLENGEIIGNLPNKDRLRFALYSNAQQAQAAAALWAAPEAQDKRDDNAVTSSETGIITWDDKPSADDKGSINGLFLHSDRMPELNESFLRGKVIQIYGPQVKTLDDSGKTLSSTRQVFWTSSALR